MPLDNMNPLNPLRPCRLLVVDLEPTPYKTDLWNTFSDSPEIELFVVYTERKNWAPDGGHNYQKWPENRHDSMTLEGKGVLGSLNAAMAVVKKICTHETDLICIAGYVHVATVAALLCSILLRRRFVMHADEFNNGRVPGRLAGVKRLVRESLRKLIFEHGDAVLVCGRRGVESASQAGCEKEKILDFPYVIDVERMKIDAPNSVPPECVRDLAEKRPIIFFSGRMIPRKGLETLFQALSDWPAGHDWALWIEGDGPELERYQVVAKDLKLSVCCRFLGFCQYDVHSWLIRSSDIVVVPSLVDTWGIVVDEGLQLGKTVVSSDATGSGYDRIQAGQNGFVFPAGDAAALGILLRRLMADPELRARVGLEAMMGKKNYRPADNLATLLALSKKA